MKRLSTVGFRVHAQEFVSPLREEIKLRLERLQTSKRSAFMTLFHAATKSPTNLSWLSFCA